jgi:flagellar basal body P-ring formation protein FlgA
MDVLKGYRGHIGRISVMVLLMLGLAISPLQAGTTRGHIQLTMPEQVEVDGAEVALGQLAVIAGDDTVLTRQLQDIVVGRAPLPGNSRTVSRDYIALRIRQSGVDPDAILMHMPERVTLVRRAVTISATDLEMLVREYVVAHPPFQGADMAITSVHLPGDIMLPTGDVQHEMQYLPQSRPSGTLPVNIFFSIDGVLVKRVMATVKVVLMKDVPVTKHPIARYQVIQRDDLMLQTMDMTDLPANTVLSFDEIEGQRARRNIGPQTVLRTDQFEFPPVVKRGDRVIILAESSGLRITTLGEVQNAAKVGERVRVVNLDSDKTLLARVIDARTVQVEF